MFVMPRLPEIVHYFHWGVINISLANLLIIVIMFAIFGLALVLPLSSGPKQALDDKPADALDKVRP